MVTEDAPADRITLARMLRRVGHRGRVARSVRAATIGALALLIPATVGAVTMRSTPPPGTPSQVAQLVKASQHLQRLPKALIPPLAGLASDSPEVAYPETKSGCGTTNLCVFGDASGTQTMVLFGDSHAEMWLSAVIPFATSHHLRLVLLDTFSCPVATVTVWLSTTHSDFTACNADRQRDVDYIDQLQPKLLVLAERTAGVMRAPGKYFSGATWEAGLTTTLDALRPSGSTIVVVGDNVAQDRAVPPCLAAYASELSHCSVPNPNDKSGRVSLAPAERAAASKAHVWFVNPVPWLCAARCAPVIGRFVAYWDAFHLTNTYATYLSRVMGARLSVILSTKAQARGAS